MLLRALITICYEELYTVVTGIVLFHHIIKEVVHDCFIQLFMNNKPVNSCRPLGFLQTYFYINIFSPTESISFNFLYFILLYLSYHI